MPLELLIAAATAVVVVAVVVVAFVVVVNVVVAVVVDAVTEGHLTFKASILFSARLKNVIFFVKMIAAFQSFASKKSGPQVPGKRE